MTSLFDLPFEDAGPEPASAPVRRRVFSVTEITNEIRATLEERFSEIWIEGEISNCRQWNSGHVYFTLKDETAQLRAVMFRSALRYLRFRPEDGLHVLARGRLGVYEPKGEYQLFCEHLEPHGLGARQLAFDQLKKRLQAEGLFDAARKRPLPLLPRKVGVVTSLDGAALRDIIKVVHRRYPNLHLVIRPARVQGEGAAAEIARAVAAVGKVSGVDVVIVGRGGGSIEDLWAFNEEVVARAIAQSVVPVIAAVGHETDVTIADFVADLRAPTPSAAAELVVGRKEDVSARIDRLQTQAYASVRQRIQRFTAVVHAISGRRGLAGWPARLAVQGRRAAELTHALARAERALLVARERQVRSLSLRLEAVDVRRRLVLMRSRLVQATRSLAAGHRLALHRRDARLRALAGRLESLSPLAVLSRGYALCWDEGRTTVLRDARGVAKGATVHVTLRTGELTCEVLRTAASSLTKGE